MNRRPRLTYANVASALAIVLAMSGTAYAAATVTSADIVNHTIREKDISSAALFGMLPEGAVYVDDDAGAASGTDTVVVAEAQVPIGNVAVFAKMWVRNDGGSRLDMYCWLVGSGNSDRVWVSLLPSGTGGFIEAMSFQIHGTFTAQTPNKVWLQCQPNAGTVHFFDVKVTALETGALAETTP